jgi:hypothetical protein
MAEQAMYVRSQAGYCIATTSVLAGAWSDQATAAASATETLFAAQVPGSAEAAEDEQQLESQLKVGGSHMLSFALGQMPMVSWLHPPGMSCIASMCICTTEHV